jgi:signal transduction histidine kinase
MVREASEYLGQVLSVAVLLSLVLGIVIGRALLARMDAVGRTASAILRDDLAQRVPLDGRNDEFDALATRLNAMLDRIQQLVRGLRETTDNVAHDLRRPLARLRNRMEITLLEPRSAEEYRAALQEGIQDADGLIRTFNTLLDIAQAEAGQNRSDRGPVNLNDLAHDLAELYGAAAEEHGLDFELEVVPGLTVSGSRELLARALGNLLENAIKYTPAGGRVRLEACVHDGAAELRVSDTGPGIPEVERAHVLERFVRLDAARSAPGNGLGLSLVRAAAAAHGAQLLLEDAAPGLRVRLRFVGCAPLNKRAPAQ